MVTSIAQIATKNAHIPSAEIERDILDTEQEITQMEREAEYLEATLLSMQDARLNHMRASARRSGIEKRREFVGKLKAILEYRASPAPGGT